MGKARERLCGGGTHWVWHPHEPCDQCRRESLRGELLGRLQVVYGIDGDAAAGCLDAITIPPVQREEPLFFE